MYSGRSAVASSCGADGSLVVVTICDEGSAPICLLGEDFTWVYAHSHGSRRGEKRPGAPVDEMGQPKPAPAAVPAAVPARLTAVPAPVAMPVLRVQEQPMRQEPVPVLKRKPLYTFGAAAALGALAGVLFRHHDYGIHRPRRWRPRRSWFA